MGKETYDEGRRDGRIDALDEIAKDQKARLDRHSVRLSKHDKALWLGAGVLCCLTVIGTLINFAPSITKILEAVK